MPLSAEDISARIGRRIHGLRASRNDSLDSLAARSGVSRSMISVIERGQTNPTAVVLDRLASALGVSLGELFGEALPTPARAAPLVRHGDQVEWVDPQSGYVRKQVSPPAWPSPLQLAEVRFPAGARVAYEGGRLDGSLHQQVWVLKGRMEISQGDTLHVLRKGDCLAVRLTEPLVFANPADQEARYLVALCDVADHGHR
jgi:transcriptional regulator with XRE-family HTH domain